MAIITVPASTSSGDQPGASPRRRNASIVTSASSPSPAATRTPARLPSRAPAGSRRPRNTGTNASPPARNSTCATDHHTPGP